MTIEYYGKAFSYDFYVPLADPKDGFEDLSAVTDPPSVYLYDKRPTRTSALTGADNPIQGPITSWTDTNAAGGKNGKTISFAAVPDPEPNSEKDRDTYYIAINYVLENGASNLLALRAIVLTRPGVISEPLDVGPGELQDIFGDIDQYKTSSEQRRAIETAVSEAKLQFEIKGWEWAQIHQQNDLNLAIAYKACAVMMLELVRDPGDNWNIKYDAYELKGNNLLAGIKLHYDNDRDGQPEQTQSRGTFLRIRK